MDEIRGSMITNGMKTSLKGIMALLVDDEWLRHECGEKCNRFPEYKKDRRDVKEKFEAMHQIMGVAELQKWAKLMSNCAAGYASHCSSGTAYIFICSKNENSMLEIGVGGNNYPDYVRQHSSYSNGQISNENKSYANLFCKALGVQIR
jgi:hypothetical protein